MLGVELYRSSSVMMRRSSIKNYKSSPPASTIGCASDGPLRGPPGRSKRLYYDLGCFIYLYETADLHQQFHKYTSILYTKFYMKNNTKMRSKQGE